MFLVTKEALGSDLETPHGDADFVLLFASPCPPALPSTRLGFSFSAFADSVVSFIGCVHGAYSSETGWYDLADEAFDASVFRSNLFVHVVLATCTSLGFAVVASTFWELCSRDRSNLVSPFSGELPGGIFVSMESFLASIAGRKLESFLASNAGRKLRSAPPPGSENRLPVKATVLLLPKLSFLDIHDNVASILPCDQFVDLDVVFLAVLSEFHGADRVVGPVVPGNRVAVPLFDLDSAGVLGGINDGFRPFSVGAHGDLLPTFFAAPDGGFHGAFVLASTVVSLADGAAFKLFPAELSMFCFSAGAQEDIPPTVFGDQADFAPGVPEFQGAVAGLASSVSFWELSKGFAPGLAFCLFGPFFTEDKTLFLVSTCPAINGVLVVAFDDSSKLGVGVSFSLPTFLGVLPGVHAATVFPAFREDHGATDSVLLGIHGALV